VLPWRAIVVVPCFNEARRLDFEGLAGFAVDRRVSLLFVDDGSTDDTRASIERIAIDLGARGVTAETLALPSNRGKGEAVRLGMLEALSRGAGLVGYFDADLAVSPAEMVRLVQAAAAGPARVVLGARVALLGHRIVRKAYRHYLGRVFATGASLILDLPVYDTQCGAKAFHRTPALQAALARPFSARWAFDVELLGRLLAGGDGAPGLTAADFVEVPLKEWRDISGSTLGPSDFPRLALELLRVQRGLRRWPGPV